MGSANSRNTNKFMRDIENITREIGREHPNVKKMIAFLDKSETQEAFLLFKEFSGKCSGLFQKLVDRCVSFMDPLESFMFINGLKEFIEMLREISSESEVNPTKLHKAVHDMDGILQRYPFRT